MTFTKLTSGIVALIAIIAATTAVIQNRELAAVRLENDALRQETAQRLSTVAPKNVPSTAEQAQRQNEHEELLRLRGEVTLLRQQQRQLAREAQKNAGARERTATAPNSESKSSAEEEWRQQGIARMTFAKQWMLAFMLFAEKNDDKLPETFDEATPYFENVVADSNDQERKGILGLRADHLEILYTGSLLDIADPAKTIVIREKEPVQNPDGRRFKTYGFADGHSEFHAEGPRGFDEWERERMPKDQSTPSTTP